MPIYDFYCPSCLEVFTFKWSFSQHDKLKNEVKCVSCDNTPLVQKIEKSNFHLKGYGWYKPNELTQGIDPYSISDREIAKNQDETKRADDMVSNMQAKGQMGGDPE